MIEDILICTIDVVTKKVAMVQPTGNSMRADKESKDRLTKSIKSKRLPTIIIRSINTKKEA